MRDVNLYFRDGKSLRCYLVSIFGLSYIRFVAVCSFHRCSRFASLQQSVRIVWLIYVLFSMCLTGLIVLHFIIVVLGVLLVYDIYIQRVMI